MSEEAELESMLRLGSRTFYFASRALPRRVRTPTLALYAFCRNADDSVDDAPSDERARDAVVSLRKRIERIYAGRELDDVVERAFARVVQERAIPRSELDLLAEGMEWDAEGRRYETIDDLRAYGRRVAGSVGVMMTHILGQTSATVLARASDLGVAMQLTNIARDVGADAHLGRVYLPLAWLRAEGVDADTILRERLPTPGVRRVVARVLSTADYHYRRADAGIAHLARDCRLAIRAARLIYADIGRVIHARGFDSLSSRAVVPAPRKMVLLARSVGALAWRPRPLDEG